MHDISPQKCSGFIHEEVFFFTEHICEILRHFAVRNTHHFLHVHENKKVSIQNILHSH